VEALRAKPRLYYEVMGLMTMQKLVLGPWVHEVWMNGKHWVRYDGAHNEIAVIREARNGSMCWAWTVRDPQGNTQHPEGWTVELEEAMGAADAWLEGVGITLLEEEVEDP